MNLKMMILLGGLILAGAVVNGAVTRRWDFLVANPQRTERLHALVVRFEDWQSQPVETDLPKNEAAIATARVYYSPRSKQTASVTFFSGVPGAVTTHTPDVCYPSSGYRAIRGPRKDNATLPNGHTVEFYIADFEKKTATRIERSRVRWAWASQGRWIAPDNPRWQFARELASAPEVYKLYIVTPVPEADDEGRVEDDATTAAFVEAAWVQFTAALVVSP